MELDIKKVKAESIQIGDVIVTEPRTVLSIEIREKGKRTLKLEGKKKLVVDDASEVDVMVPKK